jgi:hypothetical protein
MPSRRAIGATVVIALFGSGDVRVLSPTDRDQFFAGPGAGVPTSLESRIEFQREPLARSPRSGGDAKVPRRVPHDASRLRTVRTLASRGQRSPSRYAISTRHRLDCWG